MILNLPGVKALIDKFKNDSDFKPKVEWQCNDDGKAEKKGGLRWWGRSENRKNIIQDIEKNKLPEICQADVTTSDLSRELTEPASVPEPIPQPVIQQETPETPQQKEARLRDEAARQSAEENFNKLQAAVKAEAKAKAEAKDADEPIPLTSEEIESNLIHDAYYNLETINNPSKTSNLNSVPNAQEAIETLRKENLPVFLKALAMYNSDIKPNKLIPKGRLGQKFTAKRTEINNKIQAGTYEPSGSTSLFGKITGAFKGAFPVFTGGTTSTKNRTKHKSNHKSKAKTQSKPKHKNKSKSKPKHRAKTIKKNKRAHHKFDKKYTRKR
jgi:hypothetical protein